MLHGEARETYNNGFNDVWVGTALEVGEEQACKVGVETFVSGDEFIGEGQTGHKTSLLEPEDGCKGTRKEDSLYSSKRHNSLAEGGLFVGNPGKSPFGLSSNGPHGLDSIEQLGAFSGFTDVCVDEERVDFGVNILTVVEDGDRESQYVEIIEEAMTAAAEGTGETRTS